MPVPVAGPAGTVVTVTGTNFQSGITVTFDGLAATPVTFLNANQVQATAPAHAVGKVANDAGKGLFAGFGTPLLIGAGLIGLFLITRSRDHEEA